MSFQDVVYCAGRIAGNRVDCGSDIKAFDHNGVFLGTYIKDLNETQTDNFTYFCEGDGTVGMISGKFMERFGHKYS